MEHQSYEDFTSTLSFGALGFKECQAPIPRSVWAYLGHYDKIENTRLEPSAQPIAILEDGNMIGDSIGIIGLGRFGRLLGDILRVDFVVKGFDQDSVANDAFLRAAPLQEVAACRNVFFCVPISRLEQALTQALPYFAEDTLVLDVCSVKVHAVDVMERILPVEVKMLPTHPMFGPDAAAKGIQGLPFVVCPTERTPRGRLDALSEYLTAREFKIMSMTPDEHDKITAYSLCLTQLIGRSLEEIRVQKSPSDTRFFRQLLEIRDIVCRDSLELFQDLQQLNPHAGEMRRRLIAALIDIDRQLTEPTAEPV